ncbi:MAG: cutinase family protein [Solirubrobacteraceae bacterium]|nr:cutinase family protein [Patulibacter sp.]
MSLSRSTATRALALAGAALVAAVTAPAAHALTAEETFLINLPTSVTETVTRDDNPVYPTVCPKFNVVVARGTDQSPNQDAGLDGEPYYTGSVYRYGPDSAAGVWWRIASEMYFPVDVPANAPKLTAATQMLRTDLTYPASTDFPNSTPAGTKNLIRYLNRINVACPSTKFVLLGYSQGSMVIGDTLSPPSKRTLWFSGIDQLTTATTNAVVAVGLIANPGFNPKQTNRNQADYSQPVISGTFRNGTYFDTNKLMNDGNFNPAYSGINVRSAAAYPVKALPSPLFAGTVASDYTINPALTTDVGAKIRDYCKSRDYVCQNGNSQSSPYYHELYKTETTHKKNLAVFAIEKLKPLL